MRRSWPWAPLLIALALSVSGLTASVASATSGTGCDLQRSRTLRAGTLALVSVGEWSKVSEPIPTECQGSPFTLSGSGPGADFDVCWYTKFDTQIQCHATMGNETGFIPSTAAEARIRLYQGVNATYTLEAPAGPVGGEPRTIESTYGGQSTVGLIVGYKHTYHPPSWTGLPLAAEDDTVQIVLEDRVSDTVAAQIDFEAPNGNKEAVKFCNDSGVLSIPDGVNRVEVFVETTAEAAQRCGTGATGGTTGTISVHVNGGS